jgi:hypothetical protein
MGRLGGRPGPRPRDCRARRCRAPGGTARLPGPSSPPECAQESLSAQQADCLLESPKVRQQHRHPLAQVNGVVAAPRVRRGIKQAKGRLVRGQQLRQPLLVVRGDTSAPPRGTRIQKPHAVAPDTLDTPVRQQPESVRIDQRRILRRRRRRIPSVQLAERRRVAFLSNGLHPPVPIRRAQVPDQRASQRQRYHRCQRRQPVPSQDSNPWMHSPFDHSPRRMSRAGNTDGREKARSTRRKIRFRAAIAQFFRIDRLCVAGYASCVQMKAPR